MKQPQHQGEGAETPAGGDLAYQPILPLPPAGQQLGPHTVGQLGGQALALLVDCLLKLPDRGQPFINPLTARVQRLAHQVQEVRPANTHRRRTAKLPGEQVHQLGEFTAGLQAVLGVCQRFEGVDQENLPGRVVVFKHAPPIVADVLVHRRMGLDEDQSGTGGGRGQFITYPRAAILLLRGGHQQHVTVREDPSKPG